MKSILAALSFAIVATTAVAPAAVAQPVAGVERGQMLLDSEGNRIGRIERVMEDGSVRLINNGKFVVVSSETLSAKDGKAMTTMSKRDVSRL